MFIGEPIGVDVLELVLVGVPGLLVTWVRGSTEANAVAVTKAITSGVIQVGLGLCFPIPNHWPWRQQPPNKACAIKLNPIYNLTNT